MLTVQETIWGREKDKGSGLGRRNLGHVLISVVFGMVTNSHKTSRVSL